jgi:hypothetical protein
VFRFSKLVPPTREALIANLQRSLDLYKWYVQRERERDTINKG